MILNKIASSGYQYVKNNPFQFLRKLMYGIGIFLIGLTLASQFIQIGIPYLGLYVGMIILATAAMTGTFFTKYLDKFYRTIFGENTLNKEIGVIVKDNNQLEKKYTAKSLFEDLLTNQQSELAKNFSNFLLNANNQPNIENEIKTQCKNFLLSKTQNSNKFTPELHIAQPTKEDPTKHQDNLELFAEKMSKYINAYKQKMGRSLNDSDLQIDQETGHSPLSSFIKGRFQNAGINKRFIIGGALIGALGTTLSAIAFGNNSLLTSTIGSIAGIFGKNPITEASAGPLGIISLENFAGGPFAVIGIGIVIGIGLGLIGAHFLKESRLKPSTEMKNTQIEAGQISELTAAERS